MVGHSLSNGGHDGRHSLTNGGRDGRHSLKGQCLEKSC